MATLIFSGTSVAAVSSANSDGAGGVDLLLDQSQDLDGNGNPYYGSTDTITITIADEDIGPDGEMQASGADGVVTVTSITVNGVEILGSPDKIKFGDGTSNFEGDAFFFVEGVKLFFLTPQYPNDFSDSTLNGGDLELNVTPRIMDLDIDGDGGIDTGTAEEGNGVFNIYSSAGVVLHDLSDGTDDGIITGSQFGDEIYGGAADFIADGGLVADDTIDAGAGDDRVFAGDGDDSVLGGDGADSIQGGSGADTLDGGQGADTVLGGVGDDLIVDGASGSTLGYDQLVSGLDAIHYWEFEETAGTTAADSVGAQNATYLPNTNPNQAGVHGGSSAVDLSGNNGSNGNGYVEVQHTASMALAEGTFQVWINPDTVSGTDYIFDKYDGNGAQEGLRLYSNNGVLYASITDNFSTQTINTGVSVVSAGNWQHVAVSFGDGNLTLFHNGTEVAQVASSLNLTGNTEELWIGARQDGSYNENHFDGQIDEFAIHNRALTEAEIAELFVAGPNGGTDAPADPDSYDGGAGADEVDYSGSAEAVTVNLVAGTGTGGSAEGDTYTSIENVTGSAFNDSITGNAGNNRLFGGAGADTIAGGDGNDYIEGGDGDDLLTTGLGQDTLIGGAGNDTLMNAAGDDSLVGGDGDDSIVATDGNDTLEGGAGNDTMLGGADNDSLVGGGGNDSMMGETGADILDGGEGSDYLDGGDNNDLIFGGDGQDTAVGGAGDDTIHGGGDPATSTGGTDTTSLNYQVFFLGNAVEIDTVDGNSTTENASALIGNYGGAGSELYRNIQSATATDPDANTRINFGDVETPEDFIVNGVTYEIDTGVVYNATVTFTDGTTGAFSAVVIQTTDGSVFMMPEATNNADHALLTSKPIESVSLDSVAVGYTNVTAIRMDGDYALPGDTDTFGDSLSGGAGSDVIFGGAGDDTISGGADNDSLDGGDGADSILGDGGSDTILGGSGSDTIEGGLGNDSLDGGSGSDFILGGAGDDTLTVSLGNNTLDGGDDRDYIEIGFGNDSVIGGEGGTDEDTLSIASANDAVTVTFTGDEAGTYLDDDGDSGSFSEIEIYELSAGADSLDATSDSSGIGIVAGAGDDTIIGGSGSDTIDGGAGNDSLAGGGGDDVFSVSAGNDTITDFNFGNTGALGDGDQTNNDFIDLSGYYDSLDELRADQLDDGILNQSNAFDDEGKAVDYSDNTQFGAGSLTMQGATAESYSYDNTGVVCFGKGTHILTPGGKVPVETLKPGQLVMTLDHGPQPLVWIGTCHVDEEALRDNEKLRPVLIKEGVLGNERDLLVSRQHGMMLGSDHLVRAIHLVDETCGVRIAHGKREVTYVHLLFERHEIVFAEGIPSESFYPGPNALKAMMTAARADLLRHIPGLDVPEAFERHEATEAIYGPTARPFAKAHEVCDLQATPDFNRAA